MCLEFGYLLGVAVATSPKKIGKLPPLSAFPWNPTESLLSENINLHFEFTVNTCVIYKSMSSMKSSGLRHQDNKLLHYLISHTNVMSWLSSTDTLQNADLFTEMGSGVFVTIRPTSDRHPRGVLVEDPDLSTVDSRSDTSGMTD